MERCLLADQYRHNTGVHRRLPFVRPRERKRKRIGGRTLSSLAGIHLFLSFVVDGSTTPKSEWGVCLELDRRCCDLRRR